MEIKICQLFGLDQNKVLKTEINFNVSDAISSLVHNLKDKNYVVYESLSEQAGLPLFFTLVFSLKSETGKENTSQVGIECATNDFKEAAEAVKLPFWNSMAVCCEA